MTRKTTQDRSADSIPTAEQIGLKRHLTSEGYLLCEDVPIARVGWMMYGPGETPVKVGPGGYAMVARDGATLFDKQTITSFIGKSVTDDHPPDGVSPENWKKVTVGTVHNPRQGTGDDADVLLADLLITDADAIRAVQAGKREVSAGYDADYETTGTGEGRQLNIIGNHVALVERGRCGPRCAIGDHSPVQLPQRKAIMATANKSKPRRRAVVSDAVRKLILDAGMEAMESVLDDPVLMNGNEEGEPDDTGGDDNHVHVHLHQGGSATGANSTDDPDALPTSDPAGGAAADPNEARFVALENGQKAIMEALAKLTPGAATDEIPDDQRDPDETPADDDPTKAKTGDSAALEKAYRGVLADAEVLVPGFHMPTFDAKAKRKATVDAMCGVRRRALDTAYATSAGKTMLDTLAGGALNLTTMDCVGVASLFKTAAGTKRLLNNNASTHDASKLPENGGLPVVKGALSLADLNKLHRSQYQH